MRLVQITVTKFKFMVLVCGHGFSISVIDLLDSDICVRRVEA